MYEAKYRHKDQILNAKEETISGWGIEGWGQNNVYVLHFRERLFRWISVSVLPAGGEGLVP